MTLDEIQASSDVFIKAGDIAPILGVNPNDIREQAHFDASRLGFPVVVIGRRVHIPRVPFLRYLGVDV